MIIGLDFDNTIVCYDKAIAILAEEQFDLPDDLPRTKLAIRDHLRGLGREADWTRFQGELYGPGMIHAEPFPHAVEVCRELSALGHMVLIISHRTRFPFLGLRYDLHSFANAWLETHFPGILGTPAFRETKAEKMDHIRSVACDIFLDDLPEILGDQRFPGQTFGVLFKPNDEPITWEGPFVASWSDFKKTVIAHGLLRN